MTDPVLRLSLRVLAKDMRELRALVDEQAEDEGLWFIARYASEGYLQHELRRLHAEVERATRWVDADG
jgi:hypothetical protein